MNEIDLTPLAELAVTAVSVIGSILLTMAGYYLRTKWGVEIEAKHREALHSALETGARKAATKFIPKSGQVDSPAVREVVAWVNKSVPDAVAYLEANNDKLAEMAVAKLEKVQTDVGHNQGRA